MWVAGAVLVLARGWEVVCSWEVPGRLSGWLLGPDTGTLDAEVFAPVVVSGLKSPELLLEVG